MRADDRRFLSRARLAGIGDEAHSEIGAQIGALRELGWSAIELRTVAATPLAELEDSAFARVADQLGASGLEVVCLDSRIGNWGRPITAEFADDIAELRVLAARAAALNCRFIRVMSYPNDALSEQDWRNEVLRRLRLLAHVAEDTGVVLVHENCAGWAATDPDRAIELVRSVDSPALRLLFDAGNGRAHGYSEYDYLRATVDLVAHVHIKDAIGAGEHTRYVQPGEGLCRVGDSVRLLLEHGYQGYFSIEPHLSLRPHEALTAITDTDEFVSYGRSFERFVCEQPPVASEGR